MSISPCNQSLVPSLFFYFKSIQPFLNSFTVILLPIGSVVLISVPKCNFTSHSNKLLRRDLVHWFLGQSHLKGFFQNFYRRTDLHTWYHVNYITYKIYFIIFKYCQFAPTKLFIVLQGKFYFQSNLNFTYLTPRRPIRKVTPRARSTAHGNVGEDIVSEFQKFPTKFSQMLKTTRFLTLKFEIYFRKSQKSINFVSIFSMKNTFYSASEIVLGYHPKRGFERRKTCQTNALDRAPES